MLLGDWYEKFTTGFWALLGLFGLYESIFYLYMIPDYYNHLLLFISDRFDPFTIVIPSVWNQNLSGMG